MYGYSVRATAHNYTGNILFSTLATFTLLILLVSMVFLEYIGIASSLSLVSGSGAIFIFVKYVSVIYTYEISDIGTAHPILTVRQIIGKKIITHLSLDISDIKTISLQNKKDIKLYKREKDAYKYTYMPTLVPNKRLYLRYENDFEKADIFLESDEYFNKLLLSLKK